MSGCHCLGKRDNAEGRRSVKVAYGEAAQSSSIQNYTLLICKVNEPGTDLLSSRSIFIVSERSTKS